MLLVVGLACILVVVGCGDGEGSPTVTDPDPVPTFERLEPLFVPRGPGRVGPHDCGDFDSWREANDRFIAAGGPERDPYRLDPDADGIPCEALREQEPDG